MENVSTPTHTYDYYKVSFKLVTPMLGTATEGSVYAEHVIEKAKKEIEKANRIQKKISKNSDKYVGSEITKEKEIMELQGALRALSQAVGKPIDKMPETPEAILELSLALETIFQEQIKNLDSVKATMFLRNEYGHPMIASHMIVGNLKENLRIMVNNGDKSILTSKVSVGETMALDVKPIEPFMMPDKDILRAENEDQVPVSHKGKNVLDSRGRVLLERPISFDQMGKRTTAIQLSEQLPEGTKFSATLRVRAGSPITEGNLRKLLDFGKNNGLGAWRGSGNMGSYKYKLEKLEGYVEETQDEEGFC